MPHSTSSLWESFDHGVPERDAWLRASDSSIALSDLASGSALDSSLDAVRGRTVLVWASDQLVAGLALIEIDGDRKSTRLNSSHMSISYAVFCLKKKKQRDTR